MSRVAVILMNLGGPTKPEAVRPFLFNLFNDPAIIRLPNPFRFLLAHLISSLRFKKAQKIYDKMGGTSPLLANTIAQANALELELSANNTVSQDIKVFVCMRYWHPFSDEVAAEVSQFAPDQIILLPLYPQCSTTTSHSSVNDWIKAFNAKTASPVQASSAPTSIIGCYPTDEFFISAFVKLALSVIQDAIKYSQDGKKPVLLLSAHGLPESVIKEGDPYQYQIELTAKAIEDNLEQKLGRTFEVHICYQSRVGPKKWIGPASDDLIKAFAQEKRAIIVLPIAFVSDHSETLVELDQDYRELAIENGATFYGRVPSLGTHPDFIQCLVERVQSSLKNTPKPILCKKGMTCLCEKNQKLYLTSEITNEFTSNAA